jgi:hypothetical protein
VGGFLGENDSPTPKFTSKQKLMIKYH